MHAPRGHEWQVDGTFCWFQFGSKVAVAFTNCCALTLVCMVAPKSWTEGLRLDIDGLVDNIQSSLKTQEAARLGSTTQGVHARLAQEPAREMGILYALIGQDTRKLCSTWLDILNKIWNQAAALGCLGAGKLAALSEPDRHPRYTAEQSLPYCPFHVSIYQTGSARRLLL